jgi:hypothetical protein
MAGSSGMKFGKFGLSTLAAVFFFGIGWFFAQRNAEPGKPITVTLYGVSFTYTVKVPAPAAVTPPTGSSVRAENQGSGCKSIDGTWYLSSINDTAQLITDTSFAFVLHQTGCVVIGNSKVNRPGFSHLINLIVVGNMAQGGVQRIVDNCTTFVGYDADIVEANKMLVRASGSGCGMSDQRLIFERR